MNSKKETRKITLEGMVKLPLSIALVLFSIVISILTKKPIFIAMLQSFLGDFYLMKNGNCFYNKEPNDFGTGVLMFMTSHIFYAYFMISPVTNFILQVMIVIICIYLFAVTFFTRNKIIIATFYAVILILSVVNTYNFNRIAFYGGILFLISDALIGFFDIIKKKGLYRDLSVWGTYVPAQILIMLSFLV